ncbi:RimK family alpha-L-glutamate ligase [Duganella sp. FT80W]|uniref:RimK family alpha-L-glutamate ligase n=1 Tax=Duganella guangzhouensis TaxID=2666084 RepID=A0A6I2KZJ7_9BURK|nr:RimK family alpha-L-glutamate ligase [Duganella guangzhouensis]MRW89904.1 RimK family alpha-L-glutamate ligase [Duganella guangzhouensis]
MDQLINNARTAFAPLIGYAKLMRYAMRGQDLNPVAAGLLRRVLHEPNDVHAALDYSIVLQLTGQPAIAMLMQQRALDRQVCYSRLAGPLKLLVVMGPGELMWNTPVELLLEDADITIHTLYLTHDHPWPDALPEHDVLFVAIAESRGNHSLLMRLAQITEHWERPVINRPQRIAALTRDATSALLSGVPGLRVPSTSRVGRDVLMHCDFFPFIARPLDSHAGRDLVCLEDARQIAAYLVEVADEQFYVSPFVDYRSADGLYRKYRVVLIQGQTFLGHMAISSHWLVHYLNAGMDESADKRAEEAACMDSFDTGFAARHAAALQELNQRIGLDYLVIDCAELAGGELLIFEVGTAMAVHSMDDAALYPYKQPAMQKIFSAFQSMLEGYL